jgi:hypothetical protein
MKQGNGSDLLGVNDPRNASIGIIYVEPTDDRESVLAAILTQEKLGRKQIAIVLPNQNKAFQRPVDFDGLKNMRRKLQAQLVVVAPQGSGPADFARQRRFTYFASSENYAKSLRGEGKNSEEVEVAKATRGGIWPFGGRIAKSAAATAGAVGVANALRESEEPGAANISNGNGQPINANNVQGEDELLSSNGGSALGAAGLAAGQVMNAADRHEQPAGKNDRELDDAFSLPVSPASASPHASSSDDAQAHEEDAEMGAALPPPITRQGAGDTAVSPGIITFSVPAQPRNTKKLPAVNADDDEAVAQSRARRQRFGKTAPVAAGTAAIVATSGTGGNVPPAGTITGTGNGGTGGRPTQGNRRSGWRILLLSLLGLLVLSILLCGGIALAAPSAWHSFTNGFSHVIPGSSPTATVTITPKSQLVHNTYVITGITTGTPDSTKREVQARQLTFTTQPQTKTVSATGFVNTPATFATGTLTFTNGSFAPYGVSANTVFTDAQGVQVENDVLAYIPAANPNGGFGRVTVSAHAITGGTRGNIGAFDFNNMVCCANNSVLVSNTVAFGGGQDPQKFTAVQQSDIDNAAAPFKQPLLQSASSTLNGMKHENEQFIATPKCTTHVTSDHQAGDRATSVTVKVTATCDGEVYDKVGVDTIATNLLNAEAVKQTGEGFVLSGNVVTTVTQAIADNKGTVVLFVKAQGIWVAQINDARKAQLAGLIVGKTQDEATNLLSEQKDVSKVDSISISSGKTLPTDAGQITIVVQNVPGLQGTPTGTPGVGTPTPTNTLTSPVVKPSPDVTPGK